MDSCAAVINELKQRITTLEPCGLNTIWMKIKGDDDYCMSKVLGYSSDDLYSMFLTTSMMKAGSVINMSENWPTILGVGLE